jgi:hypothetical protein
MIHVIEKGADPMQPLVQFSSIAKAAKWCVSCAAMFGTHFEIWSVWTFKRRPTEKILEAEYEVLP